MSQWQYYIYGQWHHCGPKLAAWMAQAEKPVRLVDAEAQQ